jgi:hypothetical protein
MLCDTLFGKSPLVSTSLANLAIHESFETSLNSIPTD